MKNNGIAATIQADKEPYIHGVALESSGFRLVPFSKDHLPVLHRFENDISSLHLWTTRKTLLNAEEYEQAVMSKFQHGYYHVLFTILDSGEKAVGFIYSHEVNLLDGYTFVTAYVAEDHRGAGLGARAALLFYDYLFSYFGSLRKIYCEVYEYNTKSFSSLLSGGFVVEGEFKEHRYFRNRYHTLYRLALYREAFYRRASRLLQRLNRLR